jgi:hypothetical protein
MIDLRSIFSSSACISIGSIVVTTLSLLFVSVLYRYIVHAFLSVAARAIDMTAKDLISWWHNYTAATRHYFSCHSVIFASLRVVRTPRNCSALAYSNSSTHASAEVAMIIEDSAVAVKVSTENWDLYNPVHGSPANLFSSLISHDTFIKVHMI